MKLEICVTVEGGCVIDVFASDGETGQALDFELTVNDLDESGEDYNDPAE